LKAHAESAKKRRDTGIWLIALFKLAKALLLLAVGLGLATLLHQDVEATVHHWASVLWVGRESRWFQELLAKLAALDEKKIIITEAGTLVYSALLFTEGVGLLMRKRWAEYLTVIITASYIPFEVYATMRRFAVGRTVILLINIAVVWYLVIRLRAERREDSRRA